MQHLKLLAVLAAVIIAVGAFLCLGNNNSSEKTITIQGSTTVAPYMLQVEEVYEGKYNVDLQITANGSGTGAAAAINGNANLAMLSRDLKSAEKDAGLQQVVIGLDGIMAIVNKDTGVTNLSLEQLEKIFSGAYTNWSQVGGNNETINVITREEGSGTRDGFEEALKKVDSGYKLTDSAISQSSTNAVISAVNKTTGTIGYVSIGYTSSIGSSTEIISVNGVQATKENVLNGTYAIQRNLVLATKGTPSEDVQQLIDWIMSSAGQELLEKCGFISKV